MHRFRARERASLIAALASAFLAAPAPAKPGAAYQIIVHPSNPTRDVEKAFLRDVFLKRVPVWPHEVTIRPVDLTKDSEARRLFSREVLNKGVSEVKSYWHQQIFSGKGVPPPELESEAAVVAYVLRNPGGVGYVSGDTNVGTAKVLPVR